MAKKAAEAKAAEQLFTEEAAELADLLKDMDEDDDLDLNDIDEAASNDVSVYDCFESAPSDSTIVLPEHVRYNW